MEEEEVEVGRWGEAAATGHEVDRREAGAAAAAPLAARGGGAHRTHTNATTRAKTRAAK